ncbi:TPA: hypothetical protein DDY55_03730 [Candidatus Falkowbacteria bacterium]|nr:hypothetical protein [Candidatus Falkowbacteria bacterium]HBI97204.1 hypothetical protein [Candidatus Falkowbacteria bacterium]
MILNQFHITLVINEVRLTEGKTNLGKCRAEAFSGYHLLNDVLFENIYFIKRALLKFFKKSVLTLVSLI